MGGVGRGGAGGGGWTGCRAAVSPLSPSDRVMIYRLNMALTDSSGYPLTGSVTGWRDGSVVLCARGGGGGGGAVRVALSLQQLLEVVLLAEEGEVLHLPPLLPLHVLDDALVKSISVGAPQC